MCLLIAKPLDVSIEKRCLRNGFRENPHGAGFVYAKNGKLILKKGFNSFSSFWKEYRLVMKYPAIIHFRFASVGPKIPDNCHPFFIDENLAFAHNGTLRSIKTEGDLSDTRQFGKDVLSVLREQDADFLHQMHFRWLLEEAIGASKMAFIDNTGEITILNEHRGEKYKGAWYSNKDYSKNAEEKTNTTNSTSNVNVHNTSPNGLPLKSIPGRNCPQYYLTQGKIFK